MDSRLLDQTVALAGVFQAAWLAQQLAHRGSVDVHACRVSIESLFVSNPDTTEAVFGGVQNLRRGLEILRDSMGGDSKPEDLELARYILSLIQLQTQLQKNPDILEAVSSGLDNIDDQRAFFQTEPGDEDVPPAIVSKLSDLYQQTISTLKPRIIVSGEQGYLTNPVIAEKVRAVLFAGIRAAVLWWQVGGRRWHLLFRRSKLTNAAGELLRA